MLSVVTVCLAAAITAQSKSGASSAFQAQEVKFDGHGVQLAGTLVVPKLEAGKRVPAVLIVSGSSATLHDGAAAGAAKQPTYRDLAEYLAGRGLAVLRYDKRCLGQSDCKPPLTFDDYVDDARKAMDFLRKQPQVDAGRVFLFGHGEGGYIVSSVAAFEESKCAGVVLAATSGRTLGKMLREQAQNRMAETGKRPADIEAYLVKFDRIVISLMHGVNDFSGEKLDAKDPYDALLLDLIKQRGVVMSLLVNDPLQAVIGIQSPILILQGKKDNRVSVKDAQYLEEALKRASHPDATLQLFDDVDHLLKTSKGAAGADPSRPLDPAVLTALTEWIQKRAK